MDKWLKEARSTNDRERRMAAYEQAAKVQAADLPRIYLYHRTGSTACRASCRASSRRPTG